MLETFIERHGAPRRLHGVVTRRRFGLALVARGHAHRAEGPGQGAGPIRRFRGCHPFHQPALSRGRCVYPVRALGPLGTLRAATWKQHSQLGCRGVLIEKSHLVKRVDALQVESVGVITTCLIDILAVVVGQGAGHVFGVGARL